jgi:hypothetical protein
LLSSRTNQLADHHLLHSFLSIHPSTSLSSIEKKAGGVRSLSQGINPGNKLTGNKLFRELLFTWVGCYGFLLLEYSKLRVHVAYSKFVAF